MTAVNAGQIWPLIEDGCLTDWTVSMLPRGPNKEVRFTFESFRFQDSKDGEPVSTLTTFFDKTTALEKLIIKSFFRRNLIVNLLSRIDSRYGLFCYFLNFFFSVYQPIHTYHM